MSFEKEYSVELMGFNKEQNFFDFCLYKKGYDDIISECCVYKNTAYSYDDILHHNDFKKLELVDTGYFMELCNSEGTLEKDVIEKVFSLAEKYFSKQFA